MKLRIVDQARLWLGTPFVDGAAVRGVGADCAGLIEGLVAELALKLPAVPTRAAMRDELLNAARHLLVPVTDRPPQAGDILLLAQEPAGPPVHLCLMTDSDTIIHAHWRAGVVENRFGNWFQARVTHVFTWPDFGPIPPQDKAE